MHNAHLCCADDSDSSAGEENLETGRVARCRELTPLQAWYQRLSGIGRTKLNSFALGIRVDAVLLIRADVYHFNESCAESKSFGACDVEILHFYVDAHPLIPHSFRVLTDRPDRSP